METPIEPRAAVIAGGRRFRGRPGDAAWLVSVIANEGVTHVIHAGESWADTFAEQVLLPSVRVVLVRVARARERLGPSSARRNVYDMAGVATALTAPAQAPLCIAFVGGGHTRETVEACVAHGFELRTREPSLQKLGKSA